MLSRRRSISAAGETLRQAQGDRKPVVVGPKYDSYFFVTPKALMDWETFLAKAQSNLCIAQLAFEHKEYDPCVSRTYYAVFHTEIAALLRFTDARQERWKHDAVQAEFNRRLIREQKVFGRELASVHNSLVGRRHDADYGSQRISEKVAKRCLSKAEDFLRSIVQKTQEQQ